MANDNLNLHHVIKEVKSAELTKNQDQILQNNSSATADISEIRDRKGPENKVRNRKSKPRQTGGSLKNKQKVIIPKQVHRVGAGWDEDDISVMTVNEVIDSIEKSEQWHANLLIENSKIKFKIDTGTDVTVIPGEIFVNAT